MSIPLDRLYHYIESIAQEIRGDDIVIYRFSPHGSKKIEDFEALRGYSPEQTYTKIPIYCNDQEPLNYKYYQQHCRTSRIQKLYKKYNITFCDRTLTTEASSIYNNAILLHSEQRSLNLEQYRNNRYLPVYYWSHAVIALDWFRYARHEIFEKNITKQFLIYNRAWAGTREYRLKFIDLLIDYKLYSSCQVSFNPVDPETNVEYNNHVYSNPRWQPTNKLEDFVSSKQVSSSSSADYNDNDYNSTEIEIVLETLFDDNRLHLTEKILRPIACGQPFLLAASHGSLAYLRSYGFKTFDNIINETYDTIEDPVLRLEAIVKSMKAILEWSDEEHDCNMKLLNQIAEYNRKHFFSSEFFKYVTDELKTNLRESINTIENTDNCADYINRRKQSVKYPELKNALLTLHSRAIIGKIVQEARRRYNRTP